MDSNSEHGSPIGDVAETAGVSVPTVRRAAARLGLTDHRTPGGHRRFTDSDVQRIIDHLGVTPRIDGYTSSEIRVLAVLSKRPSGVRSARSIARASGQSPTAVGAAMDRLARRGLVRSSQEIVTDAGAAREATIHRLELSKEWSRIAATVGRTVLPRTATDTPPVPPTRVPRRFWHLFWNVDPSSLDLHDDAPFVAHRMLASADPGAWAWAVSNLPRDAVLSTRNSRAMDMRRRSMIGNLVAASA